MSHNFLALLLLLCITSRASCLSLSFNVCYSLRSRHQRWRMLNHPAASGRVKVLLPALDYCWNGEIIISLSFGVTVPEFPFFFLLPPEVMEINSCVLMFRVPGQKHSHFPQCYVVFQKINFTVHWRQISLACLQWNKWDCVVWVVGCSAGCCQDGRLWPKARCVKSVSQQCFHRVVNGLFPRCGFSPTQCSEWHFKGDVIWKKRFVKFWLLMFPFRVFFFSPHKGSGGNYASWVGFVQRAKLRPCSRVGEET